jgi:hypothetical protein
MSSVGSDQIELDGPELQKPIAANRIGSVRVFPYLTVSCNKNWLRG